MADQVDPTAAGRFGEAPDRAVAVVRAQVLRVRTLARRTVDRPPAPASEDVEARIRHLENALDRAYERIEVLEVLAREAVAAVDHQGTILHEMQRDVHRRTTGVGADDQGAAEGQSGGS